MNYKVNWTIADGAFAVPDCVVDNYIQLASDKAAKVILYIMRHKCISDDNLQEIAAALGKRISADDVEDALSYWEQAGVICRTDAAPAAVQPPPQSAAEKSVVSPKRQMERSAKMLTPKEIADRVTESSQLNYLFTEAEKLLGRTLTNTEQRTFIWIHDFYSMGCDIIMMLVGFAVSANKYSIAYIERVVQSWNEMGISTHEQAEEQIKSMERHFSLQGQIVSRLKLNRALSKKEQSFVENWSAAGVSIDLVEIAYDKSIDSIHEVSFNYMNTIITNWVQKGIKTPADVERDDMLRQKSAPAAKNDTQDKSDAHSYDLDRYLEHAMSNIPKIDPRKDK